jgi:hypothetical protein
MGKIEIFKTGAAASRIPAAEAALVSATLGLAVLDTAAERRLGLVVKGAGFENPSDADLAGYGDSWFR